ncbi:GNAT family N-acetyltransferase [Sulfurimonas sp. CS5]|jgi:N-acetylglutamate synthase-like GNAT family acetyltransferase|uniref:GNAT family N-acetyltransferase n=1 Tax=Sulfurimonas sp. CS5 TaxID=3391145 RepID=UPI0039EABDF2
MKIVENKKIYLKDFIRLNEEWIQKYFEIEQIDKDLAKNPYLIVEKGGYIFSIIDNKNVIGVCALMNNGNGIYELVRMAVFSQYQGKGYGSLLIETCLKKLKSINAKKVCLVSNTKLETAIGLYKKFGFKTVNIGQSPIYKRANIEMELNIS